MERFKDNLLLVSRKRAVNPCCGNAAFDQGIDLVLHQRNERRDHNRQAGQDDRRGLVTKRFSAACRQNDNRIGAATDTFHGLFL